MERNDSPEFSIDLAVHHECGHIVANARDNRLFHCMRLRRDPVDGWVGGIKPFDEGEAIPDEDDGDGCEDAPFTAVAKSPVENQWGVTETVVVNGVRVPKVAAVAAQSLVPWDEVAPNLFRYAAGPASERLRAMKLALDPSLIVKVMATTHTSMDKQAAKLLSQRVLNWSEAAFEEHWMQAVNEALAFLSQPPIWQLFLRTGGDLMSKYDGSDEYWSNWWGLSQDVRQQLVAVGGQTN